MAVELRRLELLKKALDINKASRRRRALINYRRMLNRGEAKILPKAREFINWMREELRRNVHRVSGRSPSQSAMTMVDWDEIKRRGEIIFKPVLLEVLGDAGQAIVERKILKQDKFDPMGDEAVKWSSEHSAALVTSVTDDTMKAISEVITQGVKAGLSAQKVARQLRHTVGLLPQHALAVGKEYGRLIAEGVSSAKADKIAERYANKLLKYRTQMIARTESRFANDEGIYQGYDQMGVKKLEGVSDPEACDWCQENINGQVYIIEEARAIKAEAHPQCECGWVAA